MVSVKMTAVTVIMYKESECLQWTGRFCIRGYFLTCDD